MSEKCALGKFQMAVGSPTATHGKYIIDDDDISIHLSNNSDYSDNDDEEFILDDIFKRSKENTFDLDSIMVTAVYGGRNHSVKASHLAKIWRINENVAKHTLGITTQRSIRKDDPKLSRNYGINDRMFRYNYLKEFFYMDTLFATSRSKKVF